VVVAVVVVVVVVVVVSIQYTKGNSVSNLFLSSPLRLLLLLYKGARNLQPDGGDPSRGGETPTPKEGEEGQEGE